MTRIFLGFALLVLGIWPVVAGGADALPVPAGLIHNHALWRDTKGKLIDCHEGGILPVGDKYYWYGRVYHGNEKGVYGTGGAKFRCGINCYSSTNLVDWTYEGTAFSYPKAGWITEGTWHRPRVLYNEKTSKYVLWFFCLSNTQGNFHVKDVVALSDKPAGPFVIQGERKIGMDVSGDLALLRDADGQGYIVNGDMNRDGLVFRLTADFQNVIGDPVTALSAEHGRSYEGLSVARFKGKYIVAGSGVSGLDPTDTSYAVADKPMGPYVFKGLMSEQKTWRSQISSFCYIKETDTLFALCEQWLIGPDGKPAIAEQSTQLWLPVSFNPETGAARMLYTNTWDPRVKQEAPPRQ